MEVERVCKICGRMFISDRRNSCLCSKDCRAEARRRQSKEWARRHKDRKAETAKRLRDRRREEKEQRELEAMERQNRIVAIGYAERQIENSLELAGKVKTEL